MKKKIILLSIFAFLFLGLSITGGVLLNEALTDSWVVYYVIYDANGGYFNQDCNDADWYVRSSTIAWGYTDESDDTLSFSNPRCPCRNGYYFTGWYTKASGGSKLTGNEKESSYHTKTVYAHWTSCPTSYNDYNNYKTFTLTNATFYINGLDQSFWNMNDFVGCSEIIDYDESDHAVYEYSETAFEVSKGTHLLPTLKSGTLENYRLLTPYEISNNGNLGRGSNSTDDPNDYNGDRFYRANAWSTPGTSSFDAPKDLIKCGDYYFLSNTAGWTAFAIPVYSGVDITISYNSSAANISSPSSKTITVSSYSGTVTYGTLPTLSWSGRTFNGWTDGYGGSIVTSSTAIDKFYNRTLYAKWTVNYCNLTLNAGTGGYLAECGQTTSLGTTLTYNQIPCYYTVSVSGRNIYIQEEDSPDGESVYLFDIDAVANPGYTFSSWGITSGYELPNGSKTLTASWTMHTYSVVYNANGGSGNAPGPQNNIKYNENLELLDNAFTREGYTFVGWSTNSNISADTSLTSSFTGDGKGNAQDSTLHGRLFSQNASVKSLTSGTTNGQTVTLYAIWKINTYTITLNVNNANYGHYTNWNTDEERGATVTALAKYQTELSIDGIDIWNFGDGTDVNATAYPGYTFVNFTVGGNQISDGYTIPASNVTITANFRRNNYTIKFDSNGGSGSMSDLAMTYGTSKNLTKKAFSNNGKIFAGWSRNPDATAPTYRDEQNVSNLTSEDNGIVNLYAVWLNAYTETTSQPERESGTSVDRAYLVSSPEELAWIAYQVNFNNMTGVTIKQTANIFLNSSINWNPIGTIDNPFYGIYDGQGYVIDGLTTKYDILDGQGMFGYVRGAIIENVRLLNANITSRYDAGAIIGQSQDAASDYPTTIQNCYIKANVSGSDDTGGIIGQTGSYTTIENCVFIGNLYSLDDDTDYMAAILPYIAGDEDTVIVKDVYVESNCSAFYDNTGITTNVIGKQNGSKYIYSSDGFECWIISANGTPLPGGMTWLEEGGNCAATPEDIQNWKNS